MQSGAWLPSSYHLNKVEIFSSRVSHNYKYLSAIDKQVSIAPVLKSNAYGHNIVAMAKILELLSPPFLCVYSLPEAFELLKANIKIPILIFGHINAKHLIGKKLPFSYAVYDTSLLQVINKYQPSAGVHIFVDTGMHREGISLEKLSNFIIQIKKYKNIKIEGLMSHFASGDKPNHVLTKKQIHNFLKAQEICKQLKVTPKWIHIGASTAMMHYKNYIGKIGNMARVGIALYGIDPENKNKQLKPVLRLTTTLSQIKTLSKGERVGYDFTFTAKKNMKLGVLPIGYYDGINRKLSNKGFVYLNNTKCPIIGRVSMNITTVDISKVKYPKIGQKVIIFSNEKNKENVISKIAVTSKTIPYEILVNLAASIERVVL
ncbi:MAG TPA: alanine racemase [Patescibacteria group bacterium]